MGRSIGQELEQKEEDPADKKSQLVSEICSFLTSSISCSHRIYPAIVDSSPFLDWYRLLSVAEDAGLDVIRKRYHKLALQLHPDKNKHPKAGTAFKLISQAYTCLSDNAKRKAFNLERWKHFCTDCNRIPYTNYNSPFANSQKHKAWNLATWKTSYRVLRSLRDIRERFKEEARVIENCLNATNTATKKESSPFVDQPKNNLFQSNGNHHWSRKESPVFDPADYILYGYPHLRNQMYMKPENFWCFNKENLQRCEMGRRGGIRDSPIFEGRSAREMFKSKSTRVHL